MASADLKWCWRAMARLLGALALVAAVELLEVVPAGGRARAQLGPQAHAIAELDVDDSTALAFSPDDSLLAVGDEDGRVFLFDVGAPRQIGESRPVRSRVVGLEFSPDGRRLLVAGENRRIVELDVRGGTVGRQQRTEKRIRSLDLSSDGRLVVWAGDDGTIEVLNSRLMRQDVLESPNMFGKRLAFAAFGIQGSEVFAASGDDARSAFWVLGEDTPIRRDERDREEYTAFAKDRDGRLLALGTKSLQVGLARTSAQGQGPVGGVKDAQDVAERSRRGGFGGRAFVSAVRSVRILDWNRGADRAGDRGPPRRCPRSGGFAGPVDPGGGARQRRHGRVLDAGSPEDHEHPRGSPRQRRAIQPGWRLAGGRNGSRRGHAVGDVGRDGRLEPESERGSAGRRARRVGTVRVHHGQRPSDRHVGAFHDGGSRSG